MTTTADYLAWLFRESCYVELRHQVGKRWDTTWHASPEDLLSAARARFQAGNLFTSLNRVEIKPDGAVGNEHVTRYTRLFFDLDPERPTDTASTNAELAFAKERAIGLQRHLTGRGWPMPATALSGNGFHLQYRTALPNTVEVREQLRSIYDGLHRRFSDARVTFDRSVRNSGRIAPLYGSRKRKGEATSERPHRTSRIILPRDWQQVSAQQVEALANCYAKESRRDSTPGGGGAGRAPFLAGEGDYNTLDIVALFQAQDAYIQHLGGNVHGVHCPWSQEHSSPSPWDGGDTVIFETDGSWPGFHCKHAHCAGRNIRDVVAFWPNADNFCHRIFRKVVHPILLK